jgi:hypothetical protein
MLITIDVLAAEIEAKIVKKKLTRWAWTLPKNWRALVDKFTAHAVSAAGRVLGIIESHERRIGKLETANAELTERVLCLEMAHKMSPADYARPDDDAA